MPDPIVLTVQEEEAPISLSVEGDAEIALTVQEDAPARLPSEGRGAT